MPPKIDEKKTDAKVAMATDGPVKVVCSQCATELDQGVTAKSLRFCNIQCYNAGIVAKLL